MSALAYQLNEVTKTISQEAKIHMEILSELLRDVNLEKRMETLIKTEGILKEKEVDFQQLSSIRCDLEEELMKVRKMIFMLEQAQYL